MPFFLKTKAFRLTTASDNVSETPKRAPSLPLSEKSTPRAAGYSAVVVAPEQSIGEALKLTLESEGVNARSATAIAEIAVSPKPEAVDVILADYSLFQKDEQGSVESLGSICPSASLIGLASVFAVDSAAEAVKEGRLFGFVTKPWLREELISTVTAGAEACHLRRSVASLRSDIALMQSEEARLRTKLTKLEAELSEKSAIVRSDAVLRRRLGDSLPKFSYQILATRSRQLAQRNRQLVSIARRFAEMDSFDAEDGRRLILGAALCDISLIGFEASLVDRILKAGSKLKDDESDHYESHPVLSSHLAAQLYDDLHLAEIIRSHHERYDGSGFPDGLSGSSIPWLARCLGVAVFVTENPAPQTDALESVLAESGRTLDPDAARIFCSIPGILEDTSLFALPQSSEPGSGLSGSGRQVQSNYVQLDQFKGTNAELLMRKLHLPGNQVSPIGKSLDVLG